MLARYNGILNDKDFTMYSSYKQKSKFWANVLEIAGLLLLVFLIRTFGFGLYQVPTGSMETTMLVGERFFADKFTYLFRDPCVGEVISFNEPPQFFDYSDNKLMNLFQMYVWGPSNWTKRIIGKPGDVVKGVIEDGKPAVYVNGEKLDEQYVNKFPLIYVWKEDPALINRKIQQELQPLYLAGTMRKSDIDHISQQLQQQYLTTKSYDPDVAFEDQPFYQIDPSRVDRDQEGAYELLWPGSIIRSKRSADRLQTRENYWDGSDEFSVTLGQDEYWLMGDNRLGSKDSRAFGPIKRNFIHGRIIFLIWSVDSDESWWMLDLIKHPIDFWKRVRWGRFFRWIR